MLAKLDTYDYCILPGVIQIALDCSSDPAMVDILSDIDRSNGKIYVEGRYFLMAGYELYTDHSPNSTTYLNLKVTNAE